MLKDKQLIHLETCKWNQTNHTFFVGTKRSYQKVYNNIINYIYFNDTVFVYFGNCKTSDPHRLLLKLSNKINLKRSKIYDALSNISIFATWKIIKKSQKNNKFKILAPTWNQEFEIRDGSYSVSDIQDYFEYIWITLRENTDNPSIRIYVNKIKNRITFKIKTGYCLELLFPEKMKLFGSTKSKITKDKNGENVPYLEITEIVLIHCNIVYSDYQQDSRVSYTFCS